jgi:AAA-like domain
VSRPLYTHMVNNVVFGATLHDAWAVYKMRNCSYPGLTLNRKIDVKDHLEGFAYRVSADFQVLRVSREWSVEQYLAGALRTMDSRRGHPELWRGYLEQHQHVLEGNNTARPESYLAVRLRDANINLADSLSRSISEGWKSVVRELAAYLQLSDPKSLSAEQLHNLMRVESRTFERIWGYVDCERCSTNDLQWLVRRAYTRGLGEPLVEEQWAPQAIEFPDGDGPDRYTASRAEMLRLHDSLIDTTNPRRLLVRSEMGDSYQAVLAIGTLPETTVFPGGEAELMFAPLEGLEFPVDMTFTASWIPNKSALKTAHRKKVDADNQYEEETHGHHGPSPDSEERPQTARELEAHLTTNDRPPMLRGAITVTVAAPNPEVLEERVERVRSEFGRIRLYRAPARQYELFCSTLPCQPFPVEDYREHLTIEQFAAMVPHAANRAGSEVGPYLGHTLTGSRQPILLDLSEASQSSRPPTVLALATLGGGKSVFAQKVAYEAFLCGSRVVDLDPKGDHNLSHLPGVSAEFHEEIEIGTDPKYRGLLDPLRISPPDMMFDVTVSWLTDLLPSRKDDRVVAIQEAVKRVIAEHQRTSREISCCNVIDLLADSEDEAARGAARALRVHVDQGLAQLGFAPLEGTPAMHVGHKQMMTLRVRNLRPPRATERQEMTQEELVSLALLRLLAVFAMQVMSGNHQQHKVLLVEEAWFVQQETIVGVRLIEQLVRWGRSENATVIIVTHKVTDTKEFQNMIGAFYCFGLETDEEARNALMLLGLDPDDTAMRQQLLKYRRGRCIMRDYEGNIVQMQVHLANPGMLQILDTTPRREPEHPDDDTLDEAA